MNKMVFFIWNGDPELFRLGAFALKWNAIMLILAFLAARIVLAYVGRKDRGSSLEAGPALTWLIIGALLGARLGYVVFFEPELITESPLEIFLPFEFQPSFRFTGTEGLSIHGGLLGCLVAIFLYARKNRLRLSNVLDGVSVAAVLAGVFLFTGSFLNSEATGKPTDSSVGTVFIKRITWGLTRLPCCIMRNPDGPNPLVMATAIKDDLPREKNATGQQAIILYLFFADGATEQLVNEFLIGDVKTFLFDQPKLVYETGTEPLHYTIFVERDGKYAARIRTIGVARYPLQLFQAAACLLIFSVWLLYLRKHNVPEGLTFSLVMLAFCAIDFMLGFLKDTGRSGIVSGLSLEQLLYVPFILGAAVMAVRVYRLSRATS